MAFLAAILAIQVVPAVMLVCGLIKSLIGIYHGRVKYPDQRTA